VIRNGDNVYRIWSGNIEIPKRMFPKRTEVQDMLDEMQKDINRRTNKDEAAEEANEKVDDYIFNYKRVMLMVQGILYRTEIFVPLPIGLDLFKPETHKDKVVFVYDDELSLPSGRLSFRGWHKQINSTIVKGSRVLLGRGDLDSDSIGERSMTRDRFVIYFREGNNPPGPENDVYSVEEYTTEETEYVLRTVNRAEYLEELAKVVASTNKDYKDALLDSHGKKAELKFSSKWEEVPEHISMQYQRDWDIPDDIKLMYTFYDLYTWKENGPRTHQTCDNGKWSTRTYTSWDKVTHKVTKRFLCIRYNPGDTVYAGWGKRFEEEKKLIEIQAKENAAILEKEIEEQKKIKAELEAKRIAEENVVKTPKKYLRLFSVDEGCGHCIRQDQILLGSDWKIYNGTEKDNQDKIPYHGIKESAKDLVVKSDLWEKYKAKSVPFWQLIEDGKVVKTYSGVLTLPELREFYLNLKTGENHNNPDCTCENCKCGSTCKCD
jgi:hypothetical protein